MIFVEMILMGLFATIIMDFLAKILARKKIIYPFITPEAVGRWFFYMFRGKFTHHDINKTPALKSEKAGYFISHYSISVALAGLYLLMELKIQIIHDQIFMPLIFGIVTVLLPWFWLLPSIGLGMMASKSSKRSLVLRTNFINHTNFGVGLLLWMIILHRFFL